MGVFRESTTTAETPIASAVTRLLTFAKKLFICHGNLIRVCCLHMGNVSVVVGQAHHHFGGLPEILAYF